jgi:DNA-binding response OmpR family regulator
MEQAKVLLVEDDPRLSEVITLFLSETYEVRRAATGAEAIGILRREQVAAVLLDYRLPGQLSGLDVPRQGSQRLPVIMMTGYGSELLVASPQTGISDYFTKPVNMRRHPPELAQNPVTGRERQRVFRGTAPALDGRPRPLGVRS